MLLQFSAWEVFLKGNWNTATFVTDYFPIMFFPVLYISAKLVMRVRTIQPDEMDFVTNVAEFDAMTCVPASLVVARTDHACRYDDPPPKNRLEAFWMWLVRICVRVTVRTRSCALFRCNGSELDMASIPLHHDVPLAGVRVLL